jgi:16S rRNA processing protein RimM
VYIPDGYLVVGQISGAHANRGEIKVESHSDFPDRFAPGAVVLMGPDLEQVEILTARPHKSHILITLDGITSRDGARSLQGTWLYVAEEDAAELDDDTYWIHELLGLTVITDQGRQLGTVTDVLATGANDVYVVRAAEGVNRGQDILLPAIAQVVLDVDVAAGTITVHLLPGLLDEA